MTVVIHYFSIGDYKPPTSCFNFHKLHLTSFFTIAYDLKIIFALYNTMCRRVSERYLKLEKF